MTWLQEETCVTQEEHTNSHMQSKGAIQTPNPTGMKQECHQHVIYIHSNKWPLFETMSVTFIFESKFNLSKSICFAYKPKELKSSEIT